MKGWIFLSLAILVFLIYDYWQCFYAKEVKIEMASEKIRGDIKITQISDFHSNKLRNLDFVLEKIREFAPDFIILTGDINDYGIEKKFNKALAFVKELSTLKIKTFYIIGNHEEAGPMREEFLQKLRENEVEVLYNSSQKLFINGNEVYIYGTGFYDFDYKNFASNEKCVNIILSHHSKLVRENFNGYEDFVFSGHTHGGQVRLPFIGALFAPGEGFFPKYQKGVYDYKNFKIYIDSGLGNTKFNLRFLNRIQFSNIKLKSANSLMVK